MISVRLTKFWIDKLVALPETGMGYQKVDLKLKNNQTLKNVTVYNAEECEVSQPFNPEDIIDISLSK